jgi:hypothetical protein
MKRVFETVAIVVALGACQASPPSAGPSVSGESHFLSACAATSECVAGLECLCGRCTLACADDADCEAVESGAVCPDEMTCGAGGRTCTREVTDAGFQEPCVAPADGECPADAADAFRGTRLDLERQCRIRGDEIVSCRRETLEQGVLLCRRRVSRRRGVFYDRGDLPARRVDRMCGRAVVHRRGLAHLPRSRCARLCGAGGGRVSGGRGGGFSRRPARPRTAVSRAPKSSSHACTTPSLSR